MSRALVCTLVLLGTLAESRADSLDVRRRYEEALVQDALQRTHLEIDPAPEGKTIEGVVIVANDVILPGDYGLPYKIPLVYPLLSRVTWLNHLHVRTRDYIIRQELLFHAGERLRRDVLEESGRNLRAMFILAVARIVVVRGATPDRVWVLVVTKDNWSLRLNSNFTTDQARLDTLSLSISENNLAGRNKTLSLNYALDPGRHAVGLGYADPRIAGSRETMTLLGGIYLDRATGGLEGEYAQVVAGRPLYSLRTRWAWQLSGTFTDAVVRQFQGGSLRELSFGKELIPDFYHARVWSTDLHVTRSFGVLDKLNLTAGFLVSSSLYDLTSDFPSTLSAAAREAYIVNRVPRSESNSGPYLSAQTFRATYIRLQNIDTYALSEDFRVGPIASVYVRFADPAFGFSQRHMTMTASYGAAYYRHDDLISFGFSGAVRLEPGVVAGAEWVNEVVDASFKNYSPRFGPFRLVVAGSLELRHNDLTRARLSLGSDNGLRGFDTQSYIGNDFYRVNVELRTLALNLWTVHVGAVIFYDGGDAPATFYAASWHQDAGVGLRILFPQFNRDVLRVDLGFPFELASGGGYAPQLSVSFGQAF